MTPIEPPPSRFILPDPRKGRGAHGILGIGADYEPGTVLGAYRRGIFPWPSDDVTLWCSPDPRPILPLQEPLHWSRSLRRTLRHKPYRVTVDTAFREVLFGCGDREEGTWITPELEQGYTTLHALGWAHSLEVWSTETGALIGGICGVAAGGSFSADSMFHRETDASKIAFASLAERLRAAGFHMLDAQVPSEHLASLGCVTIPRDDFLKRLFAARSAGAVFPTE